MLDFRADEQARLLRQTIPAASMTVDQLWWHYFSWGGNACQMEIDAYLHQALYLPGSSVTCWTTPPTNSSTSSHHHLRQRHDQQGARG